MKEREQFKSRIGFILLSAGCAIGIGNVWRFPYVVGENGGGIFVLFYLFFLLLIGVPILSMEFSVGRASKKSAIKSFETLEKPKQKWHLHGYMALVGNICLMIFYTTVSGWMLKYFYNFLTIFTVFSKQITFILDIAFFIFLSYNLSNKRRRCQG